MSSASGKSCFGANFSASSQTTFFKSGGKKRDRSPTTTLRKQAAFTKDNTYDVLQENKNARKGREKEDEKAMLTTWPQNLTPPSSSDSGSSGSGQSPNSTDPGSPPTILSAPPLDPPPSYKRPGYYLGSDGFETKRRRISHYVKSDSRGNNATTTNKPIARRDGRQSSDANNSSSSSFSSFDRSNEREGTCINKERPKLPDSSANIPPNNVINLPSSRSNTTSVNNLTNPNFIESSTCSAANSPTLPSITSISEDSDDPNYHPFFTTVTSLEQRERYKDDFDADFEEYQKLYPQAVKACERFVELKEKRRRELESGNREKIEEIEQEIRREYNDMKRNPLYKAKIRFDYLHEKLSHLHRLVEEYDRKQLTSHSVTNNYGSTLPTSTSENLGCESSEISVCETITSTEQLRRCKAQYDLYFEEYRPIYKQFAEIQVRFFSRRIQLEEKRRRELERGNREKSEKIEKKIKIKDDNARRDPVCTEVIKRLEYFHEKLGHLAHLINDYERKNLAGHVAYDSSSVNSTSKNSDYPDYQKYFTTISSNEQRRRYKDEYDSHCEEHRRLICKVAEIRLRFASRSLQLEEQRCKELGGVNREKSEEIQRQIMREYTDLDPVHTETMKRIDYLHAKCTHLSRLVYEWDVKKSTGNVIQSCRE